MKTKFISSMLATVSALTLAAALPADAIKIEAETMTPDKPNSWYQRKHFPNWYGGAPSGEKF